MLLFGLFTAISATAVTTCSAGMASSACYSLNERVFGADGVESTIAALGLFLSLVLISLAAARYKLKTRLRRLALAMLILWPVSGLWFLVVAIGNGNAHFIQQVLMICTGLAVIAIGLGINEIIGQQLAGEPAKKVVL
jgi:uncharacterized membrane protein